MRAVFLDLDGTLTDPKPGITGAAAHALETLGLPVPDDLTWIIGPPLIDSFRRLGAPDPEKALGLYREVYAAGRMFENAVYPGIPQALAAMRAAGARLYLATAKPHVYATRITAHFGLDAYLDEQFGPELDGTRNDKAELLAWALARTGAEPGTCVMVGDRRQDFVAAAANGMRSVGVTWGYGSAEELALADRLCDAPADLPAAVG
ncbi:HAD hydrolase-like protein [Psychromarinibacter sp. C21-152]|uniref:HAD hydrolase-like protein n=1 Tax=Psychromarinibacter sediminicola TaxID=3033385 RepID=A0AAE3NX94_9RHOB|nr:HAD family hydrolase [Psychromarinibacter sediminicola]MDF0602327.1 HAD hydrolase-like protein [Psychromarinibacter sediminicola]